MTGPRCYLIPELLEKLQVSRRHFEEQRARGALPFLEELMPRIGRRPRYRADPVDRYLSGTFRPLQVPFGRKWRRTA